MVHQGGAALKLGEYYQGSTVVAINPQINILDYQNKKATKLVLENSFKGLDEIKVREELLDSIEINADKFKPTDQGDNREVSRFVLVQNIKDYHHFKSHFSRFWCKFSDDLASGWDKYSHNYEIVYDHASGHAGEPPEVFEQIMSRLDSM